MRKHYIASSSIINGIEGYRCSLGLQKIGMTPKAWVTWRAEKGRQAEEKAQEAGTRHLERDKNKNGHCAKLLMLSITEYV